MKKWLVIVSVVALLLVASTGVGFWMLTDAKAELTDTRAELRDIKTELTGTKAELTGTQEKLEENFGYWWEETAGEEYWWQKVNYRWQKKTAEETIHDLPLRVEELESAVEDLEWELWGLR
jgi:flagellar basal body-associated protein FliL